MTVIFVKLNISFHWIAYIRQGLFRGSLIALDPSYCSHFLFCFTMHSIACIDLPYSWIFLIWLVFIEKIAAQVLNGVQVSFSFSFSKRWFHCKVINFLNENIFFQKAWCLLLILLVSPAPALLMAFASLPFSTPSHPLLHLSEVCQ